ncbi:MAG: 2-oxo acid dehydrogenase [Deltaproteobacteria bacterium]|nr:2-oxo acid dehydrogenase subunit E2 [Deltaproteobacteria bacterium]MBW2403983.1 2-oxo acid dehydrogenase subunit E2 [Deltaproteobacteria bacterium]MBW2545832.1 2-oxo acid dehydrogenase subunit E2 [Deltaproteobacteria bacterium]RLB47820.1 MAG: 2-oxo acid dehydrogenase [Deltaproteobacteria bacterium]
MPNLLLHKKKQLSAFRKSALGTWNTPYDPTVYGVLSIKMDEALRYIDAFREHTGKRLTVSHMVAKAIGAVLEEVPDANALLRFNQIYLRDTIGVFFQVVVKDPDTGEIDLSGATIQKPNEKTLEQIIDEFERKVSGVRQGSDQALKTSRDLMARLPSWAVSPLLRATSFLNYTLNLDMTWAGMPKDLFGSVMITNVGSLGLPYALVPLVPYSRVPLLLALGSIEDRAVVEDGELVARKVMDIGATFDHRILDGGHAAKMHQIVSAWMEHPFEHFDALD